MSEQVTLQHGERYGKLTVLERLKTHGGRTRYRCGCACGFSGVITRMSHLLKGRITACRDCSYRTSANRLFTHYFS